MLVRGSSTLNNSKGLLTQGELELGLDAVGAHLLDFAGEHLGGRGSAVNAVGLDGDEDTATRLEEPVGIHGHDTGLIGLGNIGKDDIDHGDDHAVAGGLTGVLDNGHDVGALGGHADQIAARARGELDGVDVAGRANEIGNVGDRGTGGTTKVEHARARLHVDVISTTGNGSAELASEGVPGAVFDLSGGSGAVVVLLDLVDRDALLAVDRLAGGDVAGGKAILLSTADDEDAGVTMRLL